MTRVPSGALGIPRAFVRRRWTVVLTAVAVLGLLALNQAFPAAVLLVVLTTFVIVPGGSPRSPWLRDSLAWVPLGACLLFASAVLVIVGTGLTGISLWGSGHARVGLLGLTAVIAAVGLVRGGRIALWSPASALAWLPALILGGFEVYRFHQPMAYWSRPVWALTDWVNNSEMVVDLYKNGLLEYTSASQSAGGAPSIYPRGLHALLAWLISGATGTDSVPAAWEAAVTGVSATVAVMSVLAIASASLLAIAVARRIHAPMWIVISAPLLTSLLMIHPRVYQFLGLAGFMTTGAVTVVLFAVLLLVDAGPPRGGYAFRLAATALLALSAFYLWQLLVLPVLVVGGFLARQWWSAGRQRPWLVIPAVVVSAVACLPLGLTSLSASGAAQAQLPANVSGVSVVIVLALIGLALLGIWTARPRPEPLGMAFTLLTATLVTLGLMLTKALGGSSTDLPYYATKILWHAGVLALPVAVVATIVLIRRGALSDWIRRVTGGRVALRFLIVAGPLILVLAYVGGGLSFGIMQNVSRLSSPRGASPQVPMVVLSAPDVLAADGRPVLPYLLHPQGWQLWQRYDDWQAAQILRTLGAAVPPGSALLAHRADEVCAWLTANPEAIRLTGPRLGYEELIERGCPASVVRPDLWTVLVTPADWWRDTAWESTGGAPDPAIKPPTSLFGSTEAVGV